MSRINLEDLLKEGVYDPGIFKAVFLIGGPGSGKSFVSQKLGLPSLGLVTINTDIALEFLMKKSGLSLKMPSGEEAERSVVRSRAKSVTKSKTNLAIEGRLGLIIDGTGADYDKVMKMKKYLENIGYDCYMVIVNTNLEVAKDRNRKRERSVPEDVFVNKWETVNDNIGKYTSSFENFSIIDNNKFNPDQVLLAYKRVEKFVKQPPKKPQAVKWIEDQKQNKKRSPTNDKEASLQEMNKLIKLAGL